MGSTCGSGFFSTWMCVQLAALCTGDSVDATTHLCFPDPEGVSAAVLCGINCYLWEFYPQGSPLGLAGRELWLWTGLPSSLPLGSHSTSPCDQRAPWGSEEGQVELVVKAQRQNHFSSFLPAGRTPGATCFASQNTSAYRGFSAGPVCTGKGWESQGRRLCRKA